MDATGSVNQGATVVITHRVRAGKHADYEAWLAEIAPLCKAAPGHLDWHLVRPVAELTETFTVIIRLGEGPPLIIKTMSYGWNKAD
jgi:antibiotic biosynthesis monooxygenase (ABM) superfamily enzyme